MDALDGILLVPPDRSHILGRASWKPRYVVVSRRHGNANARDRKGSSCLPPNVTADRLSGSNSHVLASDPTVADYCISLYKTKAWQPDDSDPVQQWSTHCVTDCRIQLVTNRKQEPVLPTLVITISDKDRRRRSSRAAGFISSNKECRTTTLWFRTRPEEQHPIPSLHDWERFILSKRGITQSQSAVSPTFTSPFSPRSRDSSGHATLPSSGNISSQYKASTASYPTGPHDFPPTFAPESLSLRSKRSDISSPSSSMSHTQQKASLAVAEQHYTTVFPTDLGPANLPGDYPGEFVEGPSSAQRRSSIMSPRTRGRASVSSQAQPAAMYDASHPPAPGETILDRAFQLGHIPGAEMYVPGQEKLSSIARFDALMREAEQRRQRKEAAAKAAQLPTRSAFDDDDSSDDEYSDATGSDTDGRPQAAGRHPHAPLISAEAQRALAYIAGRHDGGRSSVSHRPAMSRAQLSFHTSMLPASVISTMPAPRPHTSHAKFQPKTGRSQSTPHLTPIVVATTNLDQSASVSKGISAAMPPPSHLHGAEKRLSSSSSKRLSFTEFTKKLSSSSSLLLVQTNSNAGSNEAEVQPSSVPRSTLALRGASGTGPPPPRIHELDRRCVWRGVVGTEGGFL
ncbi:hypothetical protein RJ55_02535 [Drechmeria coniospora]|nr:hypothetical protein RJ55_02535 [Drechmeria coniospora]